MVTTGFEDTIAALATPPGRGALAVVRMSGPNALSILRRLSPDLAEHDVEDRKVRLLRIDHPETGEPLDRSLVTVFRAPASYTGEDVVELSTHGGTLTPQLVLDALYAAGARPALPGEFTRRAVLNGKLDLLQAEAIADLIDGRSPAIHRAAIQQIERGLSRRIDSLRASLLRVETLIAYGIDFPEEDEPPTPPAAVRAAARDALERIEDLLRTAPEGEMLREGALVVFAGYPNSGKSSLFNALLGRERAIVTEVPGTTRDAIEAEAVIGGYPFRLVDTAGLRDTTDQVESIGIEVARRYLASADIVLFCSEATQALEPLEREFLQSSDRHRTIIVRTKTDLLRDAPPVDPADVKTVYVSARTGAGLPELGERIADLAFGQLRQAPADASIVTSARQRRALAVASREVSAFLDALDEGVPMEIGAVHLHTAVEALEGLIGAVTTDDILGEVFASFCVGK